MITDKTRLTREDFESLLEAVDDAVDALEERRFVEEREIILRLLAVREQVSDFVEAMGPGRQEGRKAGGGAPSLPLWRPAARRPPPCLSTCRRGGEAPQTRAQLSPECDWSNRPTFATAFPRKSPRTYRASSALA